MYMKHVHFEWTYQKLNYILDAWLSNDEYGTYVDALEIDGTKQLFFKAEPKFFEQAKLAAVKHYMGY